MFGVSTLYFVIHRTKFVVFCMLVCNELTKKTEKYCQIYIILYDDYFGGIGSKHSFMIIKKKYKIRR